MPKAKITIEFEYELDPECWPEGYSNEQMMQGDIDLIINGSENIYEIDPINDWKVTGEIVKEK